MGFNKFNPAEDRRARKLAQVEPDPLRDPVEVAQRPDQVEVDPVEVDPVPAPRVVGDHAEVRAAAAAARVRPMRHRVHELPAL